jgi:hypothetical protein
MVIIGVIYYFIRIIVILVNEPMGWGRELFNLSFRYFLLLLHVYLLFLLVKLLYFIFDWGSWCCPELSSKSRSFFWCLLYCKHFFLRLFMLGNYGRLLLLSRRVSF